MNTSLAERDPQVVEQLGPLDEPGFTFTPTGLIIQPWVTYEAWVEYGRKLQLADKGIQWALGDWIIHGETFFKDRAEQAVEFTGLKIKTLQNYATVAENVKKSRRRDSDVVDFSTHAEVASLPAAEQERILADAERDPDLGTVRHVRREVHKVQVRLGKKKSEIQVIQSKEVQTWLSSLHASLLEFESTVPSSAPFLKNMIGAMDGVVLAQSERTIESDCRAIIRIFTGEDGTEGVMTATDNDIFKWLLSRFYFMRDPELDDRLQYMCEQKMLQIVSVEGSRQEGRRGGMLELYRLHPDHLEKLGD